MGYEGVFLANNLMKSGNRTAAYEKLRILEKEDRDLAADLRKGLWGRFVLSVN